MQLVYYLKNIKNYGFLHNNFLIIFYNRIIHKCSGLFLNCIGNKKSFKYDEFFSTNKIN